jgi:PAS domain S-box-containing protein
VSTDSELTSLRWSEARLRAAVQAVEGVLWTNDAHGRMSGAQPGWAALTGQTQAEYQGFGWARAVHPDDSQPTIDAWNLAVAERRPFSFEHRVRRHDGEWRIFSIHAVPVTGDDGDVREWVGVHTDVTEERHAEAELFDSREKLGTIVNQAAVGIVQAELTGEYLLVNERKCELLGRTRAEIIRRRMIEFVHPEDRPAHQTLLLRLAREGGAAVVEHRYVRPDGSLVWVSSHFSVVRERPARPAYLIVVVQDITDRKRAEADLLEMNAELEQRVHEEVAKLEKTQAQLIQAQRLEVVGKLTGGVAHDFNNLLQVISANLEMLRPLVDNADPSFRRRHEAAVEGARRGAQLTRQLLAFARKQALQPHVISPGRLVRDIAELMRRTLGETIEVEAVVNGGLWNTFADTGALENALINLAVNARDAMPGGGRLTLEVSNAYLDDRYAAQHTEVVPGQYVCIAVSDTGTGMTPEQAALAFEPFFSTKPDGQATGLGLAQVYGFAKQSNGHAKIYSEVNQGTTVRLYLPRDMRQAEEQVVRQETPATGGSETILVVEDDPRVQEAVVDTLVGLGYNVLRAAEAGSALSVLLSGAKVDMVFTDVVMPGPITSVELGRRARDISPGIAVLFTSGYTENSIVHHGRLDQGVALLSKPYSRDDLARKIRAVLADPGAAPAVPPPPVAPDHRRVLLVEDEVLIRMTTAALLEDMGHAVVEAGSGREALAALESDAEIDLVVLDLGLPDVKGRDLVDRLRAGRPDIPIIVATGSGDVWSIADTVPLPKPYDEAMLRAAFAALPSRSSPAVDETA